MKPYCGPYSTNAAFRRLQRLWMAQTRMSAADWHLPGDTATEQLGLLYIRDRSRILEGKITYDALGLVDDYDTGRWRDRACSAQRVGAEVTTRGDPWEG